METNKKSISGKTRIKNLLTFEELQKKLKGKSLKSILKYLGNPHHTEYIQDGLKYEQLGNPSTNPYINKNKEIILIYVDYAKKEEIRIRIIDKKFKELFS